MKVRCWNLKSFYWSHPSSSEVKAEANNHQKYKLDEAQQGRVPRKHGPIDLEIQFSRGRGGQGRSIDEGKVSPIILVPLLV